MMLRCASCGQENPPDATFCGECDMASLWEILDVSNLTYETTLGFVDADAGSGPPQAVPGWIHTGNLSSNSSVAGDGNCSAWTSNSGTANGTYVYLEWAWINSAKAISPWVAETAHCNIPQGVWCISNK